MQVPKYYYVIIGGGLSGLMLAWHFSRDIFFKGKKIAVIDPQFSSGFKTFSFWEKGSGSWDDLVGKTWDKARLISSTKDRTLDLAPYQYKMIKAADLYDRILEQLKASPDFTLIYDEIEKVDPVTAKAIGKKTNYTGAHFFDSRTDPACLTDEKTSRLFQHFEGWEITTEKPVFDPEVFTMMDFRQHLSDTTSFIYILPYSRTQALVEITFFTPDVTEKEPYEVYLKNYLREVLKITDYEVVEKERGRIIMTDYPFERGNHSSITRIGSGGGWVKPSTGYSFGNADKKVRQIITNIKHGRTPDTGLVRKRFRKYDGIFLDILANNNEKGEAIFSKFYTLNQPAEIFKFLDEETNVKEEVKIMSSLFRPEFIKSYFRKAF